MGNEGSPREVNLQIVALAVAAALPALVYALQGAIGLSLSDEGFLWYGSQRVMAGEVPIRDFMAYDIGRYYRSAAVMTALNSTGILAMRTSDVMLQMIAMMIATYLVIQKRHHLGLIAAISVVGTLMLWMLVHDFKIADYLASILLIFAISLILKEPSSRRSSYAGALWVSSLSSAATMVFMARSRAWEQSDIWHSKSREDGLYGCYRLGRQGSSSAIFR